MLGILAGSKRYAHIAGVRGDAVAAQALGLKGLVSEDSVRRALKAMAPESSQAWMRTALMEQRAQRAGSALGVLDVDATIKPLYGHQEGAELGYNPHTPGRPSRDAQAMYCTPSGWTTCVWCSMRCSPRASNTARATPRRHWASCWMNSGTRRGRWCQATAGTVTRTSSRCASSVVNPTWCA